MEDDYTKLYNFVRYIAKDYVELSQEKVRLQRDDYIREAKELLNEVTFPDEKKGHEAPFCFVINTAFLISHLCVFFRVFIITVDPFLWLSTYLNSRRSTCSRAACYKRVRFSLFFDYHNLLRIYIK